MNGKLLISLKIVLGAVFVALLAVLAMYYASVIFLVLTKQYMSVLHATPLTWLQWQLYYGSYPDVALALKKSMAIGSFASLLSVCVVILALFKGKGKRPLHGKQKWASMGDVRKAGLLGSTDDCAIILGKFHGKTLSLKGDKFVFVAAPTRTGKTAGFVIPNLLNFSDSTVVLDIKGEVWEKTAGARSKYMPCYRFDPYSTSFHSHRYNPLAYVRDDPLFRYSDLKTIAFLLYPDSRNTGDIWQPQARQMFIATGLYVFETPELPRTFAEIYRQASGNGQNYAEYFQQIIEARDKSNRPLSDACKRELQLLIVQPEKQLSGVKTSFDSPLAQFVEPSVEVAMSDNDFDFRDLRRKRMSIYFTINPQKLIESPLLVNLFFSQLINQNLDVLPQDDPSCKYKVLLMMDEFAAPGRINILAKGVAYIAGYGLKLAPIFQTSEQLRAIYGEAQTNALLSNLSTQVIYTPNVEREAEDYSKLLGYNTEKGVSKSHNNKGGGSETESAQRRAFMLPQEIRAMPNDKEIISLPHCPPIYADKIKYWTDKTYTGQIVPPPPVPSLDVQRFMDIQRTRATAPDEPESSSEFHVMGVSEFDQIATRVSGTSGADNVSLRDSARAGDSEGFTKTYLESIGIPYEKQSDDETEKDFQTMVETNDFYGNAPEFPEDEASNDEEDSSDATSRALYYTDKSFDYGKVIAESNKSAKKRARKKTVSAL